MPPTHLRPLRLATLLAACGTVAFAADPAAAPPKTHHLFMGTDVSVLTEGQDLPVKDIEVNSFVVNGPHGRVVVRPQDSQFQLRVADALKLATEFIAVDKLSFERAYAPGHDPMQQFTEAARVSAYMADSVDAANGTVLAASVNVNIAAIGLKSASPDTLAGAQANMANAQAQLGSAQAAADQMQTMASNDIYSTQWSSSRLQSDIAAEKFDALRATFELSSPRPLRTPYVIIIMRFLQDKDRPDTARSWVYAEKLPDIDEHPRKVSIYRGGFPPGYQIDSYQVHLYENGTEIATNISRKQLAITDDEAFQYSVIQHISGNRDQTKGPVKARAYWPTELVAHVVPDKLLRTVFVKVGRNGRALGIFEDEAGSQRVTDPEIAALVPALRFFPALEKGKPVEGVAAVKLGPGD